MTFSKKKKRNKTYEIEKVQNPSALLRSLKKKLSRKGFFFSLNWVSQEKIQLSTAPMSLGPTKVFAVEMYEFLKLLNSEISYSNLNFKKKNHGRGVRHMFG